MNYVIILTVIIAQVVVRSDGEEVTFTRKYCKELLAPGLMYVDHLVVDHTSNDLYFSYWHDELRLKRTARLNLKTKELTQIPVYGSNDQYQNIEKNVYACTVNHEGREVIIVSGEDRIYKYDPRTNTSTFLGSAGNPLRGIFYKDVLYFSSALGYKLYTFKNSNYSLFEDLKDTSVLNFVIDNDDTIFYNNFSGFYKHPKGSNAVYINVYDFNSITGMAFHNKGDLFLAKEAGVFYVNQVALQEEKVLDVNAPGGITFDKHGQLIYADIYNIYRLTPKMGKHC